MTNESLQERPATLTSDERVLFRKLARRLWVIAIGLTLIGAWYGYREYTAIAALTRAGDRETAATVSDGDKVPEGATGLKAALFLFSALPTFFAAWKASRATRVQIDARQAMFAILTDVNSALTWLSLVMLLVLLAVIVFAGAIGVTLLTL